VGVGVGVGVATSKGLFYKLSQYHNRFDMIPTTHKNATAYNNPVRVGCNARSMTVIV
jgi:hypothetical protein